MVFRRASPARAALGAKAVAPMALSWFTPRAELTPKNFARQNFVPREMR
jgi:hypothetical protein